MEVIDTDIEDVKIIRPKVWSDSRGYFFESFRDSEFHEKVAKTDFVQDNESRSSRGVMRGLHFQRPPYAQAKLVRCVEGMVVDFAVDIRVGSPTYGRCVMAELSAENHLQFYVPRGFAHGFAVMSPTAVFQYKCDQYYHPEAEGGISLLAPPDGLVLPIDPVDAIMSDKDKMLPAFADFVSPFIYGK
ncbi:MAG: dTDP-4-dehydrorhamnose 3,5-epimerase [Barnesiella sp.]|nr:dTDP-4-dehydrorhamnose 3,5-epimerase [Barnesiella sp.]MBD5253105.1 dTDP-4-dehydrorhamnose 3,5-epimerase [Barnesiella sp.]